MTRRRLPGPVSLREGPDPAAGARRRALGAGGDAARRRGRRPRGRDDRRRASSTAPRTRRSSRPSSRSTSATRSPTWSRSPRSCASAASSRRSAGRPRSRRSSSTRPPPRTSTSTSASSTRRRSCAQLIKASTEIQQEAYAGGDETPAILDRAEQRIFAITDQRVRAGLRARCATCSSPRSSTSRRCSSAQALRHRRAHRATSDLDKLTAGFQNSDLVIIAGRPVDGEDALALNIAENAAIPTGKHARAGRDLLARDEQGAAGAAPAVLAGRGARCTACAAGT